MRLVLASILLLVLCTKVNAQDTLSYPLEHLDSVSISELDFCVAYSYNSAHQIEIGIIKKYPRYFWEVPIPSHSHGASFTILGKFGQGSPLIAPKLGYELNWLMLKAKISSVLYTDFKNYDLKIVPEAGFTLYGYIDLTYSNNITIGKSQLLNPKHQINIGINMPWLIQKYTPFYLYY